MGEVMVLQNDVSAEGMRRLRLMSELPISLTGDHEPGNHKPGNHKPGNHKGCPYSIPEGAEVKVYEDELRIHHLDATWRPRGELVEFRLGEWRRLVALWGLTGGETVRGAILSAAEGYALATGRDPEFAWVRRLPKGVEDGTPLACGRPPKSETDLGGEHEVLLLYADWVPEKMVAVGRGNSNLTKEA